MQGKVTRYNFRRGPSKVGVGVIVFYFTFNNILEEIGVPGEYHQSASSHWQTLSHNVVSSTPHHKTLIIHVFNIQ
jgi:hypothetical protein